jgi:glycerol-1-phosphate dehydrogenase [NAD(P)+]
MRAAYGGLAEGFLARNPLDREEATSAREQYARLEANWDELKSQADALYASRAEMRRMLEESGGPVRPEQVGVSREDVRDALLCAWLLRPRFTLLKLAFDLGVLKEIVDEMLA